MSYANMFDNAPRATQVVDATQGIKITPVLEQKTFQAPVVVKPQVNTKLVSARSIKDQMGISEFGTQAGKEVAALSDIILKKTTTGKMGDFGDGITQILTLTSQVNVDDLNIDKNKGILGKALGFLKKKKVEVIAQFEDTSSSIEKIKVDLERRQVGMREDNDFLQQLYDKNLQEYHDLGFSIEAAEVMLKDMNVEYEVMKAKAENSSDQFEIQAVNEFEQRIKLWEKQIDRLKRMQQVALLTAPEIKMIQAGNVSMVEKFNDLINTTLPAWKKQLSMTILALKQKENAELGNKMDDKTNEFFKKAASLNNQNAIAVAKASERSVVDIETLEFMQQQLIDSVKQVKQIQEEGRKERASASTKIEGLREQMKQEMLSWQK